MEIKIEIGNWQYNAGIVGLVSILDNFQKNSVRFEENSIYFDSKELENFEEKYFNYLIKVYEKTLSWHKIVSFENKISYFKGKEIDENDLKEINTYIKDILKKYLKSSSYVTAYDFIQGDIDPIKEEKNLKPIILKKNEKISDKSEEIKETLDKIENIIKYFTSENGKKYICGKNLIYTIIKNGWGGVSFLNAQTKEKDIYKDFKNYFITPVIDYLESDKTKYKYNCFLCSREIKNLDNDFNFLINTGFDISRKTSHVWNFNNDITMCPICKLVYSCVPVGFTYVFGSGIFINSNTNAEELIRINSKIKAEIYREEALSGIYRILNKELQEDIKYELEDIQLVRFETHGKENPKNKNENKKYFFNILSKNMIRVLINSKTDFEKIENTFYKLNGENYNLNDDITRKILNNENLFNLIHKIIYSKISGESQYLSEKAIFATIKINFRLLKERGYMENKEIDVLVRARSAGKNLKEKYDSKKAEHKLQGICYRILNGLKTNNISMTMDTILNCYLYCDEGVPKIITEMMSEEETFKEIGYAFVSGLLSIKYDENDKGGN
ncbi:MAG: type I-B CRISPR-associated protein Cas8b1/Cst1 [Fusobacterium sp.]|uniref:type I-B CRISPR-associated protein Cas8b1/Cst1 n=1 Tax=Fusobacterium sp. TaxID=68766 RepID=UPI002A75DC26|nr:type I-B CRISPR-associated protein Cas8b1/Cst1 [Fusobacterium sp.]MDY2981415.1 type I-B CRISPR-associated protein Cas8b1/Cst1 [Fusobacterium sp.]